MLSRGPSRRLRQDHRRRTGLLLPHGHGGSRFWHKAPAGQGSWRRSATNRRTHPRRNTLTSRRRGARRVRGCGGHNAFSSSTVLAGSAASAAPPTLSSHNVATATRSPQPRRAGWMAYPCTVPWPARAVGALQPLFDPGPQAIPACCAGLRPPSGQDQPRIVVAVLTSAPARGTRPGAVCGQAHAAPTRPGSWDAGPPGPPTRRARKLPPVLLRTNGGHPRCVLRRNNQGADTPRSAHTSTIQP